jgi:hypothetical protein
MQDLSISLPQMFGFTYSEAVNINDHGQILIHGMIPRDHLEADHDGPMHTFLVTPTP